MADDTTQGSGSVYELFDIGRDTNMFSPPSPFPDTSTWDIRGPEPLDTTLPKLTPITVPDINVVADSIRKNYEDTSYFELQAASDDVLSLFDLSTDDRLPLQKRDIPFQTMYQRLNSGDYISRYPNYIYGTDNEDRLGREQGAWEKAIYGVGKFLGKTGVNALGGTVGMVNGILEGTKTGTFNAVYNNDFNKWLDDLNTKMDNNLPHYYTQAEREASLFRQAFTGNFWANDVPGALSFIAGTVLSEGAWAFITGGSSLAVSFGKVSLRAAGKKAVKEATEAAVKAGAKATTLGNSYVPKSLPNLYKAYLKTIPAAKAGRAINNGRFLYTSTGYEAGMMARHNLKESTDAYISSFKEYYGRNPTQDEMREFTESAIGAANTVYAANTALVGGSNILMLGGLSQTAGALKSAFSRPFYNMLGQGIKTTRVGGKLTREALKPGRLKNFVNDAFQALRTPVYEGFVEEGGQGWIDGTSKKWLAARYNPSQMKENFGLMEAAKEAFGEAYGTKEGRKEILLGFLVGAFGGITNKTNGKWTPFQFGRSAQITKQNEQLAERLDKSFANMVDTQKEMLERFANTNQMVTYLKTSEQKAEEGEVMESALAFDAAQFSNMRLEEMSENLDESVDDYSYYLENMEDTALARQAGVDVSRANDVRKALLESYKDNVNRYKEARDVALALSPSMGKGKHRKSYADELAYNIYMGKKSAEYASMVAEELEAFVGKKGVKSAVIAYSRLNAEQRATVKEAKALEKDIADLENQFALEQQAFTTTRAKQAKGDKELNRQRVEQLDETEARINGLRKSLVEKRQKALELRSTVANALSESEVAFGGQANLYKEAMMDGVSITDADITNLLDAMDRLETYGQHLEKSGDKAAAETLLALREDYSKALRAYRDFNIVFNQMLDPRTNANYRGLAGVVEGITTQEMPLPDEQNTLLDGHEKDFEAYLENNNLTEEEEYNARMFFRLVNGMAAQQYQSAVLETPDAVTAEEYGEFRQNGNISDEVIFGIAQAVVGGQTLDSRQKDIYAAFKERVEQQAEEIRFAKGMNPIPVIPTEREAEETLLEYLERKLDKILESSRYFQDLGREDAVSTELTRKEIGEYNKLFDKIDKGRILTTKQADRFQKLKEKINKVGLMQGKVLQPGETLEDLVEHIRFLRKNKGRQEIVTTVKSNTLGISEVPFAEDGKDDSTVLTEIKKNRKPKNAEFLQSPSHGMYSREADGTFTIHHLSLGTVLNALAQAGQDVTLMFNGKELPKNAEGKYEVTDYVTGTYRVNVNGEVRVFRVDDSRRINITEDTADFINSNTGMRMKQSNKLLTDYQPILVRMEKADGQEYFTEIPTDFGYGENNALDTEAIRNTKKGNSVHWKVDMSDPYNKREVIKFKAKRTKRVKKDINKALKANPSKVTVVTANETITLENAKIDKGNLTGAFEEVKMDDILYVSAPESESSYKEDLHDLAMRVHIYGKSPSDALLGSVKAIDPKKDNIAEGRTKMLYDIRMGLMDTLAQNMDNTGEVDLEIGKSVALVYLGHPRARYMDAGNNMEPILEKPTQAAIDNSKDIGYLRNGKLKMRNGNENNIVKNAFLLRYINDPAYEDKTIPVVTFKYAGRWVAYPVSLNVSTQDLSSDFDEAVVSDMSMAEKVMFINKLMMEGGIDIDKYGLNTDNLTEEMLDAAREALSSVTVIPDVAAWLDKATDKDKVLNEQVLIDVDFGSEPFMGTKIRMKLDSNLPKPPQGGNEVKVSSELVEEGNNLTEQEC